MLTVWPWKVLSGRSLPSRHTWMHMSVLQEAKVVLFCQSTSRAGAEGGRAHMGYKHIQARSGRGAPSWA